ncbi:radical SAM protein [Vibrio cholerae]|uniref:Radical SAM protein n=1 Tax=Vibrio cholerae TaxID=666 RepID=A0A5Q6PIN2_VIBCL|nr:radical SAM protein [Vibrio cholerae]KAA1254704.1 radical SAM protein [Vibrio cholerae]
MINTIIAKPTKDCNADCAYCSSPPDMDGHWTFERFKTIFDLISPKLAESAVWIWHGGEPMLLGDKFYIQCWDYVKEYNAKENKNIKFSMQSNILLYSKKWKPVFRDVMKGSVSTSFDPDMTYRTLKGSTEKYAEQFYKKLDAVLNDGFNPMVVSTYSEESAHLGMKLYEKSLNSENQFHLRFNYRYPAGRANNDGNGLIHPQTYGKMLIELYDRWLKDTPSFSITPLDQMLDLTVGGDNQRCPWIRGCNGKFLGIEPNGDLYNCADFADLKDEKFKFGNVFSTTVKNNVNFDIKVRKSDFADKIFRSPASRSHARRVSKLPMDCKTCRHFHECQGGCMRDAELYNRGLGGKFFYCESWMMVFDRIKESVLSGEADGILVRLGYDPEHSKNVVSNKVGQIL